MIFRAIIGSMCGSWGVSDAWKFLGLVSRFSNGPHRACSGLLLGLKGDRNWTYQVD